MFVYILICGLIAIATFYYRRSREYYDRLMHDAKTGSLSEYGLQEKWPQLVANAHKKNEVVVVMFLDLIGFKAINDATSPQEGDYALWSLVQHCKQSLRIERGDLLSRLQGDEYVVAMSIRKKDATRIVADVVDRIIGGAIRTMRSQFPPLDLRGGGVLIDNNQCTPFLWISCTSCARVVWDTPQEFDTNLLGTPLSFYQRSVHLASLKMVEAKHLGKSA